MAVLAVKFSGCENVIIALGFVAEVHFVAKVWGMDS